MTPQLALLIVLPIVATASTIIGGDGDVNITATGNIELSAASLTVNGRPLHDVITGHQQGNSSTREDVAATAGPPGKAAPDACSCCASLAPRLAAIELQLARAGLAPANNATANTTTTANATSIYTNCGEIFSAGNSRSGVYDVDPRDGLGAFRVFCDMTNGGGWTVFQRRQNGSVDFYRNWADYKAGFGDLDGEFWLGLDKIHRLTATARTLRIDLRDFDNESRYAQYETFSVADEADKYKITFKQYSGDAGNSLSAHNGQKFSTKDRDNDRYSRSCATKYFGAWWYNRCHYSNLNGKYQKGFQSTYSAGVVWRSWRGYAYSLKFTEMKIR